MVPGREQSAQEDLNIVLPEDRVEIFGGTIEASLNALLRRHVETAKALDRTTRAQQALTEVMDRAVILMQDPAKPESEAVRELVSLFDLQAKLRKEREQLELAYAQQEQEYARIKSEMERLAKEHPELFLLATEPAAA